MSMESQIRRKKFTIWEKCEISRFLLLISLRLSKKVLEKSKLFKGKNNKINHKENAQKGQSYAQVLASNINEIMKIKDSFPNLSPKEIHKMVNKKNKILKPRINITTKEPSRRQVLVLMNLENSRKFKVNTLLILTEL